MLEMPWVYIYVVAEKDSNELVIRLSFFLKWVYPCLWHSYCVFIQISEENVLINLNIWLQANNFRRDS